MAVSHVRDRDAPAGTSPAHRARTPAHTVEPNGTQIRNGEPGARRRCQPVRWTCRKEVVHAITNMVVDHDDQPPASLIPRALADREQHPLGPRRTIQRRRRQGPDLGNAPPVLAAIRNIGAARRAASLDPTAAIRLFYTSRNRDKSSPRRSPNR